MFIVIIRLRGRLRMSRITRRRGCNDCVHAEHQHDENYICVKKQMWVWPWLTKDDEELPDCEDYQSSGETANVE